MAVLDLSDARSGSQLARFLPRPTSMNFFQWTRKATKESGPNLITKDTVGIQANITTTNEMSDPTTQSNYLDIATRHLSLEWTVDFEAQTISGKAVYELEVKREGVREVMSVFIFSPLLFGLPCAARARRWTLLTLVVSPARFDTAAVAIDSVEVEGETVEVSTTQCFLRVSGLFKSMQCY